MKSSECCDQSVQSVTWTSVAEAEALLIENSVVTPLLRSTSKYGRRSVEPGAVSGRP